MLPCIAYNLLSLTEGWGKDRNNNNLRKTSNIYWVSTPYKFHATYSHSYYIDGTGKINKHSITNDYGVRPMISLKAGTKFSSGDGSTSSPYVIE